MLQRGWHHVIYKAAATVKAEVSDIGESDGLYLKVQITLAIAQQCETQLKWSQRHQS